MNGLIKMKTGNNTVEVDNSGWYRYWFDSTYYPKLYGHRDEKEAAAFIDALTWELEPNENAEILDLGCGYGRHSRQLASKGFKVTGLDLSASSIREAKKSETDRLHYYKLDMRVPFGENCFDYVFNFFTSFGYFKKQHENFQVISNISDALRTGGTLLLDYLNMHYTEKRLVPFEQKEIDGVEYTLERWSDDFFFYKRILINETHGNSPLEFVEQVSKFSLYDFDYLLSRCKLRMEKIYGDYQLNSYERNASPRLIIVAKKT